MYGGLRKRGWSREPKENEATRLGLTGGFVGQRRQAHEVSQKDANLEELIFAPTGRAGLDKGGPGSQSGGGTLSSKGRVSGGEGLLRLEKKNSFLAGEKK